MMYWGNGDLGWGSWVAMIASMVLFWGLIAWAIVTFLRRPADVPVAPEQVLAALEGWSSGAWAARWSGGLFSRSGRRARGIPARDGTGPSSHPYSE